MHIDDSQFSEREKEVIGLLLRGKSNKQIALTLGISVSTVEYHLKNVYRKLQVNSRVEVILRLGKSIGNDTLGELGKSTVEINGELADNGGKPISTRRIPMNKTLYSIGGSLLIIALVVIIGFANTTTQNANDTSMEQASVTPMSVTPTTVSLSTPTYTGPGPTTDCWGYEILNDWTQAAECYRQQIVANPYDFYAIDNLARVYQIDNQHDKAENLAQELMFLAHNAEERSAAILRLGVSQYYLGDYASAVKTLLQGVDSNYSQTSFYIDISYWLASSYNANGEKSKACEQYQVALTLAQQKNYKAYIISAQNGLASCP